MKKLASINIYSDGGSRGNPGESAYGFYIEDLDGNEIASVGRRIGVTTNNIAEYSGILEALYFVNNSGYKEGLEQINFFMDSNLAVNQLNGLYKIKNAGIREIFFKIKTLESDLKTTIIYKHVPREENKKADKLVNLALDFKI